MGLVLPNCGLCAFSTLYDGNLFCEAPQLDKLLDSSAWGHNTIAPCGPVRDFKFACGHSAKWFVSRSDKQQEG